MSALTRYDRSSLGEDLTFKKAKPIAGGQGGASVALSKTAVKTERVNTFQGRYIIRHEWQGEIKCENPQRGRWGHPPAGVKGSTTPESATDLAFATRGGLSLASMMAETIPESVMRETSLPKAAKEVKTEQAEPLPEKEVPAESTPTKKDPSSGCSTGNTSSTGWAALVLMLGLYVSRRKSTQV